MKPGTRRSRAARAAFLVAGDTWNVGVLPSQKISHDNIRLPRDRRQQQTEKRLYGEPTRPGRRCAFVQLKFSRCHVVGFAFGGQIVQAMAISRPDLVATLTMAAAGPGSKGLMAARGICRRMRRTKLARSDLSDTSRLI